MSDMVRIEAPVYLMSMGQLEAAFEASPHESVFAFLREFIDAQARPLLLTSDRGLACRVGKPPAAPEGE